jgi:molybdenum-dependent DNA-binding transcriptional regulator ModE
MDYKPKLSLFINERILNYKFFEALDCVAQTWSQREASKKLDISHAVLNRRIKDAEDKLGFKLVYTTGAGSKLTEAGLEILQQYRKLMTRLRKRETPVLCGGYISAGIMEALTMEYGLDVLIYQTDDESALYLADMDMIDILTLDDPVKAFMRDLDFTPIAYDHLVLVSPTDENINSISELEGKKFVEIPGSSQRLAWNTLDNLNIDYEIVKLLKSPSEALKAVKNSEDLYTFLNSSFTNGSDVLKNETKHLITLVLLNQDDERLKKSLEFILSNGRKLITELGFERI